MKSINVKILFLSLFHASSASAARIRISPRTLTASDGLGLSISPTTSTSSLPSTFSLPPATSLSTSILPSLAISISIPTTGATPTKPASQGEEEEQAFITPSKATVTPAAEVIIDADGRVLTLSEADVEGQVQEKWHLTTFTSCNTFDATFTFCGVHEPVLPGGDEIAAAVRPLDARGGILRAFLVVFGTLVGVDVFLR